MGRYEEWRASTLRVFRSKRTWGPGERLVLGGPGVADLTDCQVGAPCCGTEACLGGQAVRRNSSVGPCARQRLRYMGRYIEYR